MVGFYRMDHPHHSQQESQQAIDGLWLRLRTEALETLEDEPELSHLLNLTVLAPGVASFEDAVASAVAYRLCSHGSPAASAHYSQDLLRKLFADALRSRDPDTALEHGHFMADSVRADASTVVERDPACQTLLEVVLFNKGFAALVCHRAARQKWHQTTTATTTRHGQRPRRPRGMVALYLQSQASASFGVDIHPAAAIGAGILLDHGTGVVIGETARVGDGCTILQGVTLGGTGKEAGDRHPKVGKNVFIGAGANVLGNISIGDGSKIGAGSIVLRPVPDGATAVGSPARIILPKQQNLNLTVDTASSLLQNDGDSRQMMVPSETSHLVEPDAMSAASSYMSTTSLVSEGNDCGHWHQEEISDSHLPLCPAWRSKDYVGVKGRCGYLPSMVKAM